MKERLKARTKGEWEKVKEKNVGMERANEKDPVGETENEKEN